ncbi:MAG TPA: hypothetical protein VF600_01700 [Abditibacteriaceae bacterium]|jgi:hypothetical protein
MVFRFCVVHTFIAAVSLAVTCSAPARAESEPASDTTQRTIQPQALSATDLEREPSLAVKVSFEAKHRPLSDVFAEVSKQSRVTLAPAPNLPLSKALVTARVKDMPLSSLLGALSRVYGFWWSKNGENSYVAHPGTQDELERKILQMGHRQWFRYRDNVAPAVKQNEIQLKELAYAIVSEAGVAPLRSAQGVPVASLSEDLRLRLRKAYEEFQTSQILAGFWKARSYLTPGSIIRFKAAPDPLISQSQDSGVDTVQADDAQADEVGRGEAVLPRLRGSIEVYAADGQQFLTSMSLGTLGLASATAKPGLQSQE